MRMVAHYGLHMILVIPTKTGNLLCKYTAVQWNFPATASDANVLLVYPNFLFALSVSINLILIKTTLWYKTNQSLSQ